MGAGVEENTLTKALGVLQEQGVYACFLYLLAREEHGKTVIRYMRDLLTALGIENTARTDLDYAQEITADCPACCWPKKPSNRC